MIGRWTAPAAALVAGLLTVGFYTVVHQPPLAGTLVHRYTTGHPVEAVTLALFLWALVDLVLKATLALRQRRALDHDWFAADVRTPEQMLAAVADAPRGVRESMFGRRLAETARRIAAGESDKLDGHLRHAADRDADMAHERYALTRIVAWAIPILGFLGTVLGITIAIARISPEQLETSLPAVTGGLAVAFDTTALALSLSMVLMFALFLAERLEYVHLLAVEEELDDLLQGRVPSTAAAVAPELEIVRQASREVIEHTRRLVEQQAELWSRSLQMVARQSQEERGQQTEAFRVALGELHEHWSQQSRVVDTSTARLEQTGAALADVAEGLRAVIDGEGRLLDSQQVLAQNLQLVQRTQGLDEAVHSLTAAIHLMTMRHAPAPPAAAAGDYARPAA